MREAIKKVQAVAKPGVPPSIPEEIVLVSSLRPHPGNYKRHPEAQLDHLEASIREYGIYKNVVIAKDGTILAGHGVVDAANRAGVEKIPVRRFGLDPFSPAALKLVAIDNESAKLSETDDQALVLILKEVAASDLGLLGTGYDDATLAALLEASSGDHSLGGEGGPTPQQQVSAGSLREKFLVPPFSVLDARQGYWRSRKNSWLDLGIDSELGRASVKGVATATGKNSAKNKLTGRLAREKDDDSPVISIFDPVLCELAYRWFCPPKGRVLDPFAGGSVRGVVAAVTGRSYEGVDLREEQVAANRENWKVIQSAAPKAKAPKWRAGDSLVVLADEKPESFDFIFSCPPYFNLEIYSDDKRDLSTMSFEAFCRAYEKIVALSARALKPNRFACFVVGEVRKHGKGAGDGSYVGFVPATIRAFEKAGLGFYNEAVLVQAIGTLPLTAGRAFVTTRKLGKVHQNVLCFCKGDVREAVKAIGDVEFGEAVVEGEALLGGEGE